MNIFASIGQFIVGGALVLASLLGYHQQPQLGAVIYKPIPRYESSLAIAIDNVSTSSLTLVNGKDNDGNWLSGNMCFTVDSGVANSVEDICGVASGTVISDLIRGTDASGVTSNPADAHAHRVGADVKVTDSPYLAQYYRLLNGLDTFPSSLLYATHPTSTASTTIEDKNYIDTTAVAGAPAMTNGVAGIGLLASTTELQTGVATGTASSTIYSYVVSSQSVNQSSTAYRIPIANASGTIDPNYINGTSPNFQNVNVSGTLTAVGTSTFSNVTSSLLQTNSSGTVSGTGSGATTSSLLFYNNGKWQAGLSQLIVSTSTSVNSATNVNLTTTTIPVVGNNDFYEWSYYLAGQTGTATTTISINGTSIATVRGINTSGILIGNALSGSNVLWQFICGVGTSCTNNGGIIAFTTTSTITVGRANTVLENPLTVTTTLIYFQ